MAPVPPTHHARRRSCRPNLQGRKYATTRAHYYASYYAFTALQLSDFTARNAQASTNGARPPAPSNLTTGAAVSSSPYARKKRSRVF